MYNSDVYVLNSGLIVIIIKTSIKRKHSLNNYVCTIHFHVLSSLSKFYCLCILLYTNFHITWFMTLTCPKIP